MKPIVLIAAMAAFALAGGCGKKEEPPRVQETPPPQAVTPAPAPTPVPPLPQPQTTNEATPPTPTPGQANDHSNPAFKEGGPPDPAK